MATVVTTVADTATTEVAEQSKSCGCGSVGNKVINQGKTCLFLLVPMVLVCWCQMVMASDV